MEFWRGVMAGAILGMGFTWFLIALLDISKREDEAQEKLLEQMEREDTLIDISGDF